MSSEVIDTNVLTIATAPTENWVHPRIPLRELKLILKVFEWVRTFRENDNRKLVMDCGKTILEEYSSRRNMPSHGLYGRRGRL